MWFLACVNEYGYQFSLFLVIWSHHYYHHFEEQECFSSWGFFHLFLWGSFYFHCCQYPATTDHLQLMTVPVTVFQLYDGMKATGIRQKPYSEFSFFSKQAMCSKTLSHDAGWGQWAAAPSRPRKHENNRYPDNHCVYLQPFCFTFSTVFNYMKYSTLYYKIGSVLDDFAQL